MRALKKIWHMFTHVRLLTTSLEATERCGALKHKDKLQIQAEMMEKQDRRVRLLAAIKECRSSKDLSRGKKLHQDAIASGLHINICVATTLVDMFSKCSSMKDAQDVFDKMPVRDVAAWTALIMGYAENREGVLALKLFARMVSEGCRPNSRTYIAALLACASLAFKEGEEDRTQVDGKLVNLRCLEKGMALHSEAEKSGFASSIYFENTLLDMYAKSGSVLDARMVFDRMVELDVVSWTAMIAGYADNSENELALELFRCMEAQGCPPNDRSYLAALKACANMVAVGAGREVHANVCRRGLDNNVFVGASLVDFYGKCGGMAQAILTFDGMHKRDLATWSALITGYSHQGDTDRVLSLFQIMEEERVGADAVVLLAVLTAYCHSGSVGRGKRLFDVMSSKYGVAPDIRHYTCMVDMLGRFNRLKEALVLLQTMPLKADVVTWTTLLGACQKWKDVEVGRLAFESLVKLEGHPATAYVLMRNIYGSSGLWDKSPELLEPN